MDEDLKAYLDSMRSDVSAMLGEMHTIRGEVHTIQGEVHTMRSEIITMRSEITTMRSDISTLRGEMNDGQEKLLNRLTSLEQDFLNTKGFLVGDAVVSGRRWLDIDDRLGRLERGQKP